MTHFLAVLQIGIFTITLAANPVDKQCVYGYSKVETFILSIIIAAVIINTGITIVLENVQVLLDSSVFDTNEVEKCILAVKVV